MICLCAMECDGIGDDAVDLDLRRRREPDGNCMPSGKARTGYDFGRHIDFNDERVKTWAGVVKDKTATSTTTPNPKPKGTSVNAPVRPRPTNPHDVHTVPKVGLFNLIMRVRVDHPTVQVEEITQSIANVASDDALRSAGLMDMLNQLRDAAAKVDPKSQAWPVAETEVLEALETDVRLWLSAPGSALPVRTTSVAIQAQIDKLEADIANALSDLVDTEIERDTARGEVDDAEARAEGGAQGQRPRGPAARRPGRLEPAAQVFQIEGAGASMFNFRVPVWHWEDEPDEVPVLDPNYIFRPMDLFKTLMTIVTDQRMWLKGHTGTGKTTLVEQVAARLRWPVLRINFDSEITRLDLIGRDVLRTENGQTVSMFADGLLPKGLAGPYILLLDEFDRIRPDIAYVMQRALEGNGLTVVEDGGRHIVPHQWTRTIATANTAGQGDDTGLYPGARPQSAALLDRFTSWADIDYLSPPERQEADPGARPAPRPGAAQPAARLHRRAPHRLREGAGVPAARRHGRTCRWPRRCTCGPSRCRACATPPCSTPSGRRCSIAAPRRTWSCSRAWCSGPSGSEAGESEQTAMSPPASSRSHTAESPPKRAPASGG